MIPRQARLDSPARLNRVILRAPNAGLLRLMRQNLGTFVERLGQRFYAPISGGSRIASSGGHPKVWGRDLSHPQAESFS